MNMVTMVTGVVLVAACFGLMVWGQRYLGEEKGRSPGGRDKKNERDPIDNPCRRCGACPEKKAEKR